MLTPVVVLVIAAAWGAFMRSTCKFQRLSKPIWPFAENPGLALELADSLNSVDAVLGAAQTNIGDDNRKTAALLQRLDFDFVMRKVTCIACFLKQIKGPAGTTASLYYMLAS